jgi:inner membrane protein
MPTIFSHSLAAIALGTCRPTLRMPARFWVLAAVCAALPDADALGFGLGIHYSDPLGHRGLTHSSFFALAIGFLVVILFFRKRRVWIEKLVEVVCFFLRSYSLAWCP